MVETLRCWLKGKEVCRPLEIHLAVKFFFVFDPSYHLDSNSPKTMLGEKIMERESER